MTVVIVGFGAADLPFAEAGDRLIGAIVGVEATRGAA
jgi:hypothetical protein